MRLPRRERAGGGLGGARGRPWREQMIALIIAQFLAVIGFSCFHPFLPLFIQELGIEGRAAAAGFVGIMLFLNSLSLAVLAPLWGAFADRIGPKMMAQRALIGSAVLVALMGLARNPTELLIGFCALGAVSGVMVALTTLASAVAPLPQVGRSIGLMQAALFTGTAIGPLGAGLAANVIGYRWLFLIGGGFMIVAGLLVSVFVQGQARGGTSSPSVFSGFRYAAADRPLLALTILVFLLQVGATGVQPVIPIFVQEIESDPQVVNLIVGASSGLTGLTGAIGAIWIARFAERFGHALVLSIIAALGGVFQLPLAFATTSLQIVLFRGLFGSVFGGFLPVTGAMTAQLVPADRRGIAYGLTGAAFSLGNGIGPLLIGTAVAWVGIRGVFALEAVILLVTAIGARWASGAFARKLRAARQASEAAA